METTGKVVKKNNFIDIVNIYSILDRPRTVRMARVCELKWHREQLIYNNRRDNMRMENFQMVWLCDDGSQMALTHNLEHLQRWRKRPLPLRGVLEGVNSGKKSYARALANQPTAVDRANIRKHLVHRECIWLLKQTSHELGYASFSPFPFRHMLFILSR